MEAPAMQCWRGVSILCFDVGTVCAHLISLFWAQPYGCWLLAADHKVDVILCAEAVGHGAQEAVCIRRQVNTSESGLEVQDGADERWVLMGEAIVFLTSPSRSLDIVEGATWLTPGCLVSLQDGQLGGASQFSE